MTGRFDVPVDGDAGGRRGGTRRAAPLSVSPSLGSRHGLDRCWPCSSARSWRVPGLFVPWLIARVPRPSRAAAPEPEEPEAASEPPPPVEPPEPYADIAALPGLGWRSAVGRRGGRGDRRECRRLALGVRCSGCRSCRSYVALALIDWRTRLLPTCLIRPVAIGVLALVGGRGAGDRGLAGAGALDPGWLVAFVFFFVLWFDLPARAWGSATSGWPGCSAWPWAGSAGARSLVGLYAGVPARRRARRRCSPCSASCDRQGIPVRPVHAGRRAGRPASGAPTSGAVS